ncbi:MAG: prepilin peptidase-dependent protein, partial [Enterobacteriaceae bacterium]
MLIRRAGGFTLPEMVLAMALGAVMILSIVQSWPALWQQSQTLLRRYQLEATLQEALQPLFKDVRRAGFCAGNCTDKAWRLGAHSGEARYSCILLSYDLNRNGEIEPEQEWFGYRLRAGNLESLRGATQCDGGGWQRVIDERIIRVTLLQIEADAKRQPAL